MIVRLGPGVGFRPAPDPLVYSEFQRRVRRYPRSALLRRCAAVSVVLEKARMGRAPQPPNPLVQPFSVAGVARTCLAAGTEHRSSTVTDQVLARLCSDFIDLDDLDREAQGGVERLLAKFAFEQFTTQYSPMENLARTGSLLLDHADEAAGAPTSEEWIGLLGVDREQYMRVGFAAHVAMLSNGGAISRELLQAEHVAPIFAPLTPTEALAVLDQHFIATLDQLRDRARQVQLPGREKWSVNPLASTPLVQVGKDLVAPAVHYLPDKITPTGLYYTAAPTWRSRFTDALGIMFERYVGTQLRLLSQAVVHSEITYASSQQRSCDYLLVFDEVVLLVEVKAARPTINVRAGLAEGEAELDRKIGHARNQLLRSASLIRDRHPAFIHIPADRPLVGLILTLEPFYLQQSMRADTLLADDRLPMSAAWAHDLEGTVACLAEASDAGARLLQVLGAADPGLRALNDAAVGLPSAPNPILHAAFQRWATWPHQSAPAPWGPATGSYAPTDPPSAT